MPKALAKFIVPVVLIGALTSLVYGPATASATTVQYSTGMAACSMSASTLEFDIIKLGPNETVDASLQDSLIGDGRFLKFAGDYSWDTYAPYFSPEWRGVPLATNRPGYGFGDLYLEGKNWLLDDKSKGENDFTAWSETYDGDALIASATSVDPIANEWTGFPLTTQIRTMPPKLGESRTLRIRWADRRLTEPAAVEAGVGPCYFERSVTLRGGLGARPELSADFTSPKLNGSLYTGATYSTIHLDAPNSYYVCPTYVGVTRPYTLLIKRGTGRWISHRMAADPCKPRLRKMTTKAFGPGISARLGCMSSEVGLDYIANRHCDGNGGIREINSLVLEMTKGGPASEIVAVKLGGYAETITFRFRVRRGMVPVGYIWQEKAPITFIRYCVNGGRTIKNGYYGLYCVRTAYKTRVQAL